MRTPFKHHTTRCLTTVVVLIIGLVILIIAGYIFKWSWTGFEPETSAPQQHAKTLWDWLQLLIIPLVLAVGGYVFNLTVSRNEQQNTRARDKTEREISLDNQQEAALQAYIDKMSELLLDGKLRESVAEDEVRKIARVRTLTVLPRLDNERKGSVLQFLYESRLIQKDKPIVDLNGANIEEANLIEANLIHASLRGAYLKDADLVSANLEGANLSDANLEGANLSDVDLSHTKLIRTKISHANLRNAILKDANLSFAILEGADLRHAYLEDAHLGLANLEGADLEGADLTDIDLFHANLRGASISQNQLDKAKSLQKAIMPDGSTHA